MTKVLRSILGEIMEGTFQKLETMEEFNPELILELRRLTSKKNSL